MHHAGAGKVVKLRVGKPALANSGELLVVCDTDLGRPGPVGLDGVDHSSQHDAEDDVPVEVAPFGDGARHDGCAGGGEGALEEEEGVLVRGQPHCTEVRVTDPRRSVPECKGVPERKECPRAYKQYFKLPKSVSID